MADDTSVRVALRVRPQSAKEKLDLCQVCTVVSRDEPQVWLGKDKAFTYDHVFDLDSVQDNIYDACSKPLIEGCFEGYNATIFAYGQTGSGKTYTMGTGFDVNTDPEEVGIIPRAVNHLFHGIDERRQAAVNKGLPPPEFKVNAQFMELYNEEIIDLLDTTRDPNDRGRKTHIKIHEDAGGGIYTVGINTRAVSSPQETMQCLHMGSLSRTTASTNMNAQSSRSHAVFTLYVRQQRVLVEEAGEEGEGEDTEKGSAEVVMSEFETLTAKFHFVDLAGSERLKRTGATGDRAKEGISINCGLLALGNVISALGDKAKKGSHVPYRDSKLTRLLQDSLGGNSQTVMIACVSPSDRDFMETLNTMKYANRARNIKNKVSVNQDKTSKQIAALRMEITELQAELLEYKTGKRVVDADGLECVNDMFHENTMLQTENSNLRNRIKAIQHTVEELTARNIQVLADRDAYNITNMGEGSEDAVKVLIEGYVKEIEELRTKLMESEAMAEQVKRSATRMSPRAHVNTSLSMTSNFDLNLQTDNHVDDILSLAKKDVKKLKKKKTARVHKLSHGSDKENLSEEEKQDHEDVSEAADKTNQQVRDGDSDEGGDEEEEDEEDEETMESGSDTEDEEDSRSELDDSDMESDSLECDLESKGNEGENNEDTDTLHEDLADLTCDISIKQKLIEELEMSQRRLNILRGQYEDKIISLQGRIQQTESERDKALSSLGTVEHKTDEKAQRLQQEYGKKLQDMQAELKKVQVAKKEHAKLLRNQSQYEKQLKTLQKDLADMKKYKVKLMNQIKEDQAKSRSSELRRGKEIAKLKKEQRMKDNQIRSLEADQRKKETVLRRKQEEVQSLRKRQKTMSSKAAGRVGTYDKPATVPVAPVSTTRYRRRKSDFNPKAAKSKWDNLEKSLSAIVSKKQTLSHMEKDMERWIKQRESLTRKLDKFVSKRKKLASSGENADHMKDLSEQIDSLQANVAFVQENINECQSNIMLMEEGKEDEMEPTQMLSDCTMEESKYLLEHVVSMVINKGMLAAQKEAESRELSAKLHQERMDHMCQRDLLQHLIMQNKGEIMLDVDTNLLLNAHDSDSEESSPASGSTSPIDSMMENPVSLLPPQSPAPVAAAAAAAGAGAMVTSADSINNSTSNVFLGRRDKARRKTATPHDLLFAGSTGSGEAPSVPSSTLSPLKEAPVDVPRPTLTRTNSKPTPDDRLMPPPRSVLAQPRQNGSVSRKDTRPSPSPSPTLPRKTTGQPGTKVVTPISGLASKPVTAPTGQVPKAATQAPVIQEPTATAIRSKTMSSTSTGSSTGSRLGSSSDFSDHTPPTSPTAMRRSRDGNVFSRLTAGQTHTKPTQPSRGVITAAASRSIQQGPLLHSHTAVGHTRAVLSVFATEDMLFSSSKDRSAKIWDLQTGEDMLTLKGHPNNVTAIRYCEETGLVFTASTYFTQVWDPRQGSVCIKTLTSAGQTESSVPVPQMDSQVSCPAGETNINDIAVNSTGTSLYSAAGNTVRIWDLKMFKSVGKLSGGHQSAVMVLAVDDTDTADGNICVVTGSKDHYIKVFDLMEDSVGVLTPKYNLEPPHYDGIQSLCLMGDLLFSGSRDMCIKKWDLAEQQLKQSMNNAHKDWVCGLAFMPGNNCLLSGCRGGYLKLWHIDTCAPITEIRAHSSPINSIATNSSLIFSASNEFGIKFWTPDYEKLPALEEEFFL